MSKENVKKFFTELCVNEAMQEELAAIADKAGIHFTREEFLEVLAESGTIELSEEELGKISAGAYPTAVNSQITDAVT